ncbi:unnamed protein product [Adineta ricciae]|uniref:F5/8 type C domain-containing protein n=1 Tax=Adineta ricciae TaxID=249248 RepID=A0A813YKK4_ADIRI|nr:unnamed protein product [Adineta ricciae]
MKFLGGICENIYGEVLKYEIIQHENNRCTECRLERQTIPIQKWLIYTLIFTYLAALVGVHRTDSKFLMLLSIVFLIGVLLKAYLKVKRECVIIGNQTGLQLTTTYVIGRQTTVYISSDRIQDVLINEGFLSQRLIYYLTLMINDDKVDMDIRHEDQQRRQQLLTIVDRGTAEQLFSFLQQFHRRPFRSMAEVISYEGVIDDQIDFIDCVGTKYNVTPLIIAAGKGSYEKTKILLVHGANPNQQCSTGDTALNLAVHRQKYHIADLLAKYHANPNVANQSGKTALHRAVVSYVDENANHIRVLLHAGADPTIEDRNQRIPLDEAVVTNKPEIVGVLLSYDGTLTQRAYRAAIIAARLGTIRSFSPIAFLSQRFLGHDKCLQTLLDYGMDPNICDRSRTTPLHVAIRSLKLSTARLLISHGADQNFVNNRGETPTTIAEYLPPEQQQLFINILTNTPRLGPSEFRKYTTGTIQDFFTTNIIPYVHPLLRSHPNWTLDSDEFRSRTDINSSVQNLLDASSGTYWCSTQPRDAWVVFDLKHQFNISGMRVIGCENQSTPKSGHLDVSNAFNGPWLKVKDFTCSLSQGNKTDIFFAPLKTRFIRVFITDNHGGDNICIQGIGFYGVDMRLVNLLREHGLERSLQTLLANDINDLETLDEKRDEILNSSDKYLDINDHFQFIRLMDSLRRPVLTFLEWFNAPQSTVVAGEKLQTFSAAGDEGATERVRLEEKSEDSSHIRTIILRDLEPIQGRSLVDFPDYSIQDPGRYQVRVVNIESPDIRTQWQDIIVENYADSNDDFANDSSGFDYPSGGKIRHLTPSKFRVTKRAQLPNVFPLANTAATEIPFHKGEYTLTPSKYRLKKNPKAAFDPDYENFNHRYRRESQENTHPENHKPAPDEHSRVIGDFILTKRPPESRSIYSYKPKNTHTSYIYKGTLEPSEVQQRAANEMQYIAQQQRSRRSSESSVHRLAYVNVFSAPRGTNDGGQSNYNQSYPSIYPRSASTSDRRPGACVPASYVARYYFGEKAESASSDEDDWTRGYRNCVVLSRPPIPRPCEQQSSRAHALNEQESNYTTINNDFQHVMDIGTSTKEDLRNSAPAPTSDNKRLTTLSKQLSSVTNQSPRSESETYRVDHPDIEEKDNEDVTTAPWKTANYPTGIATSGMLNSELYADVNSSSLPQNAHDNRNKFIFNDSDTDEEDRFRSTPKPSPSIGEVVRNDPLAGVQRSNYETNNNNHQRTPIPKPPTISTQKPGVPSDFSTDHDIHRPVSTSPTGLNDELMRITTNFDKSQHFRPTPRPPYHDYSGDDDSEDMQPSRSTYDSKGDSRRPKGIDESTQSEEKSTRNVGTMHESVETRNFGHEVQPQSSSTQTSFSLKDKPSKPPIPFIERPEHRRPSIDDPPRSSRISPRPQQQPYREEYSYRSHERIPYECPRRRSPSPPPLPSTPPPQTTTYYYDPRFRDRSPRHHSPYRPTTSHYRTRTPTPPRPPRSTTRRRRPQMHSQETDTSLDAMKHQQHAGVQYDPRSTHERGTTPSLRSKKPTSPYRPLTPDTTLYSPRPYPTSSRHHSPQSFQLEPSRRIDHYRDKREYEEEEEEPPVMHDKSTMAELTVSFDHYTQCDAQPFMADRYIQTTPTNDDDEHYNSYEYSNDSDIRQLPRRTSTYIPQPIVIQPDTLPRPQRSRYSPTRPKRDGLDYTGNILELSLHHGQQQRTTPIPGSPVLHIGTENVILQSSTDEYTIPFETRYIHDSFPSRTGKDSPFISTIRDSPQTRLFSSSSPVRQSKSNGNFFLTTAPTRSLNSSFRLEISADDF